MDNALETFSPARSPCCARVCVWVYLSVCMFVHLFICTYECTSCLPIYY